MAPDPGSGSGRRPPAISFIVPVRNDAEHLQRCLASLAASAALVADVECVVADNGSTDSSAEVARSAGATVLPLPGVNVSTLRNRAAAVASAPLLAFVDADHEVGPGWVRAAMEVFQDEWVGGAGASYLSPGATWTQRLFGALRGRTVGRRQTEWLASGNLIVRRSVFADIRGFDESLETCEDVDFCQRLRRAGWRLFEDERLKSIHYGDPRTLGDVFRSERWRGRDNLRLSLRSTPSLRDLPSIAIPLIDAAALATAIVTLVVAPFWRPAPFIAAASMLVVLGLAGLRAIRMLVRGGVRGLIDLPAAWVVALAYDGGRAVSLIWPARHRRSRPEPPKLPMTRRI